MVGDLAGEEMMRESTDPEPDPAESKCGGSTWTVLISVIVCDDDGDLRENVSVSRCHPGGVGPSGVLSI